LVDAITEIVHQGNGELLNAVELRNTLDGWQPNCSLNYEYVFVWKPTLDPSRLEVNWSRPQLRILRRAIKRPVRLEKIRKGSPLTDAERRSYLLEYARQKPGYQSAQELLETGTNCYWADLSFVTDSKGREVYILEIALAVSSEDEDLDSILDRHQEIWQWKDQPLTIAGPFTSVEEAELWMDENGAFREEE